MLIIVFCLYSLILNHSNDTGSNGLGAVSFKACIVRAAISMLARSGILRATKSYAVGRTVFIFLLWMTLYGFIRR